MQWAKWFAISLFVLCLPMALHAEAPHPCAANVGYGPLSLRGQSPFQMLHLSLSPSAPSTLPAHHWEGQLLTTWVNRWAVSEGQYFIDNETLRIAGKLRYGLTDWFQVGIEVPVLWRGGGVMDSFIEGFHRTFGLDNGRRDEFPRNRFRVEFHSPEGSKFALNADDAGIGLQDIVLSSQATLTCGGAYRPATAVHFSVSLPTGRDEKLYGTGGVDVSVALLFSKRLGDLYLYLNGGYVWFGTDEIGGIRLRKSQGTIFTGVEYRLRGRTSLILQNLINSGAAEDFFEFSEYTDEMTLGMKTELSPGLLIELGLIENLIHFTNSPDFGVHGGVSYRF